MGSNNRLNLLVAESVAQRFQQETEFLNLGSRIYQAGDLELKSKADMVRWAVRLYIEACEAGDVYSIEYDETLNIPFYMGKGDRGVWEYAIKQHFADSYSQLATYALARYFHVLDEQLEGDRQLYQQLQSMPPGELLEVLRGK